MSWKDQGLSWRELRGIPMTVRVGQTGGWYRSRHPQTTQEKRLWDSRYGRSKRSPRRLPCALDEPMFRVEHTWKRHRDHQYHD